MQADRLHVDTLILYPFKHIFREMKPGCRCGDRTPELGIEGLITFLIYGLCIPVQIWRNRNSAANLQDSGESRTILP